MLFIPSTIDVQAALLPACVCTLPQSATRLGCSPQWQRFAGFVQAGDAKEAWLCIRSAGVGCLLKHTACTQALHVACPAAGLGQQLRAALLPTLLPASAQKCMQPAMLEPTCCPLLLLPRSATVLKATLPAALLAFALHSSVWGGAPPGPVAAAEAAAYAGAAVAAGTELWKILEGFQG